MTTQPPGSTVTSPLNYPDRDQRRKPPALLGLRLITSALQGYTLTRQVSKQVISVAVAKVGQNTGSKLKPRVQKYHKS